MGALLRRDLIRFESQPSFSDDAPIGMPLYLASPLFCSSRTRPPVCGAQVPLRRLSFSLCALRERVSSSHLKSSPEAPGARRRDRLRVPTSEDGVAFPGVDPFGG